MLANEPRIGIIARVSLTTVMLLNALAPTTAIAMSLPENKVVDSHAGQVTMPQGLKG